MRNQFLSVVDKSKKIYENPGNSVEELQNQVKTLAECITEIANYLNQDITDMVIKEIANKNMRIA